MGCQGGRSSKGWAVDSKPGTRVDGDTHHKQESWFFKYVGKRVTEMRGGKKEWAMRSKGLG